MTSSPPAEPADTPDTAATSPTVGSPTDVALRTPRVPLPGQGQGQGQPAGGQHTAEAPAGASAPGAPLVESVRRQLDALEGRPLAEQPEKLEHVYAELQAALAQIDTA